MEGKYKVYVIDWKVCYFLSWMSVVEGGYNTWKQSGLLQTFILLCLFDKLFSFGIRRFSPWNNWVI